MVCAKLFRQRLLVLAARDGNNFEAHLGRELDAEVAESTDAEDGDKVARPCHGLAQGVERRDARAQQRCGVDVGEIVGDTSEGFRRRDHVLGIAAVVGDARDLTVLARDEITTATRLAGEIAAAEPADADAVTWTPGGDAVADCIDDARDLVAGSARERVAHPAGHGQESEWQTPQAWTLTRTCPRARFGNFDVGQLEFFIRRGDAGDLHRCHDRDITPTSWAALCGAVANGQQAGNATGGAGIGGGATSGTTVGGDTTGGTAAATGSATSGAGTGGDATNEVVAVAGGNLATNVVNSNTNSDNGNYSANSVGSSGNNSSGSGWWLGSGNNTTIGNNGNGNSSQNGAFNGNVMNNQVNLLSPVIGGTAANAAAATGGAGTSAATNVGAPVAGAAVGTTTSANPAVGGQAVGGTAAGGTNGAVNTAGAATGGTNVGTGTDRRRSSRQCRRRRGYRR